MDIEKAMQITKDIIDEKKDERDSIAVEALTIILEHIKKAKEDK